MKTFLLIFLFACFFSSFKCRPFHTITVDGNISDWDLNTEAFPGTNNSLWLFTWDATTIYVGVQAAALMSSDLVNLYIDTDPTSPSPTESYGYGTTQYGNVFFPFLCDWNVTLSATYIELDSVGGASVTYQLVSAFGTTPLPFLEFAFNYSSYIQAQKIVFLSGSLRNNRYALFPEGNQIPVSNSYYITQYASFVFGTPASYKINHPAFINARANVATCCPKSSGQPTIEYWPGIGWIGGSPNNFSESAIVPSFENYVELSGNVSAHSVVITPLAWFNQLTTGGTGKPTSLTLGPRAYIYNEGVCCPPTMVLILTGNATITSNSTSPLTIPILQSSAGIIEFQHFQSPIQILTLFSIFDKVQVIGDSPQYINQAELRYSLTGRQQMGSEWTYGVSKNAPKLTVMNGTLYFSNNGILPLYVSNLFIGKRATLDLNPLNASFIVQESIINYGVISLSIQPNATFEFSGIFNNFGLFQRNGKDILCPQFNFTITEENGCSGIQTNVTNIFFGPLSYLWSNGATQLNIGQLSVGTYQLTYNETGANGCPPLPILSINSSICSTPIQMTSKTNRTLLYVYIGAIGGGLLLLLLIMAILLTIFIKRKNKKEKISLEMKERTDFIGHIIPHSELRYGKKLGEGAFGVVYKGMYKKTEVAIKKLLATNLTETELENFKLEAKLMIQLPPHPNIVLFRGICVDPLCIVVDFCDGGSLHFLIRQRKLPDNEKFSFALDIARGMLHLHTSVQGKAVIHRDLATRNILISGKRALVADFGMARAIAEDSSKTQQTVGPLKWMAPEAFLEQKYSVKSDSFSYGVTLYELVTQEDPWVGLTAVQATYKVSAGKRMSIPQDCPPVFTEIMVQSWNTDPSLRPDFNEICDKLLASASFFSEVEGEKKDDSNFNPTGVILNSGINSIPSNSQHTYQKCPTGLEVPNECV